MTEESSMRHEVRARLRGAGYELVQFESPLDPSSKVRPDVVAWAADRNGELVPWAVVVLKTGQLKTPELAFPALARSRDLLGTLDHYAVVNGQWFKADRSVRSFEPVDGPTPPRHGAGGLLSDEGLATSLLLRSLWRETNKERGRGAQVDFFPSVDLMAETNLPRIETADGFVPVRPDVLWHARRRALLEFASRAGKGETLASNPVIAQAVAELAGPAIAGTVLDPFCGTGSFLWAAMDRALQLGEAVAFVGVELNKRLAEMARTIGQTAPLLTTIKSGDAFEVELPTADVVLAAPPLGMRLREPRILLDGSTTTDMAAAAVDLALRHVRPGGRAVVHVAAGFTFQQATERYRQYLASEYRVAALIGTPGGAIPGTSVRSVLIVIDRGEPGETIVAQLGEDWETQLAPGGAALTAALVHVHGDQSGS